MRDYGKLSPFFWTRGSGKRLRGKPEAQIVAAYLSTAPSANMIGIYYVSIASIANDTGIPEDRVRAALEDVEASGYASYDHEQEIVWVPNHAHFEIGENLRAGDKRRPRVYAELRQVSGHRFADEFRRRYGVAYGLTPAESAPPGVAKDNADASAEGPSKGHPSAGADKNGASASDRGGRAGQVRAVTGQDQDQDRSGGHPPEPKVLGLDGEGGAAWQAWRTGISLATGKPTSEIGARDKPDLVAFVNAHAGGLRGEPLMAWIAETAAAFVKANDGKYGGFTTKRCRDWLDAGRLERAGPGGVPRQKIGAAASAPWMNPTSNFDFGASK